MTRTYGTDLKLVSQFIRILCLLENEKIYLYSLYYVTLLCNSSAGHFSTSPRTIGLSVSVMTWTRVGGGERGKLVTVRLVVVVNPEPVVHHGPVIDGRRRSQRRQWSWGLGRSWTDWSGWRDGRCWGRNGGVSWDWSWRRKWSKVGQGVWRHRIGIRRFRNGHLSVIPRISSPGLIWRIVLVDRGLVGLSAVPVLKGSAGKLFLWEEHLEVGH